MAEGKDHIAKWFAVLAIVTVNIYMGMSWYQFTPIPYEAKQYYARENIGDINDVSFTCFLIYFFSHIVAVFIADRWGPGVNFWAAIIIMVPSAVCRVLAVTLSDKDTAFMLAKAASYIAMMSGANVTILPAKVASIWFPDSQRTLANSLASISNQVALMFAYAFGPTFVKEEASQEQFQNLATLAVSMAGLGLITTLVHLGLSKWHGLPTQEPPSKSSREILLTIKNRTPNVGKSFLYYYKDGIMAFGNWRGFLFVTIIIALGLGIATNVIAATPEIMCPYDYGREISSIGALVALNVGGYIGIFLMSAVLTRWRRSDIMMRMLPVAGTAFIWLLIFFMPTYNHTYLILGSYTLFGFCMLPALPLAHELAVECTYPLGAGLSSGMMNIVADLIGFVTGFLTFELATPIGPEENLNKENKCNLDLNDPEDTALDFTTSLYILGALWTIGVSIFAIGFKCPYLRRAVDQEGRGNGSGIKE